MVKANFLEFSKEFEKRIEEKCEENVQVKFHNVMKNNGVILHGITLLAGNNLAPTMYEENFFEMYKNRKNMDQVVDYFFEQYNNECPGTNLDMEFFMDFDQVKSNICYKIINKNRNEELLGKIPHIAFMNLAICFYYSMDKLGDVRGSILIHNEHMDMWKTNTQELYQYAASNTPKMLPVERIAIQDMLEGIPLDDEETPISPLDNMYVITNPERTYGAISLFYPGVLEETGEFFHGNYYIIPSSVHEMLLIRDSGIHQESYLKEMVKCVNSTAVSDEEYLSNHPYYYDLEQKKLRMV